MRSSAEQNFRNTWENLLNFALRKGVPYQDAEDLVSATLQIALDQFARERGEFLPFCTTVLGNKIKNYWRDRKPNDPIEEMNLPDRGHTMDFELAEERARMKKMIDRIRENLTDEENAFMNALGAAFEELESRAVSEAARSLGLEPEKGWDVFRRIQRKAKSLFPHLESFEMPAAKTRPTPAAPPELMVRENTLFQKAFEHRHAVIAPPRLPFPLTELARFALRERSYMRAVDSLTAGQKSRFSAIFS